MNENNILNENKEAMEAITEFAKACYAKGSRDTIIGVMVGAGLVVVGYASMTLYQICKDRKETKKLKKSINEFCEFVKEGES